MHIYEISQLYRKHATTWEDRLSRIEDGRDFVVKQYDPFRRAAVAELRAPGRGQVLLDRMFASTERSIHPTVAAKSRRALKVIRDVIAPRVLVVERNLLHRSVPADRFALGGQIVEGRFHAQVVDTRGVRRFLYFHPSEWDEDQVRAYIELLTIMAEECHGEPRTGVWFIDALVGDILPVPKSFKAVRKELAKTADLLARFKQTLPRPVSLR